jgi:hypothetical protein
MWSFGVPNAPCGVGSQKSQSIADDGGKPPFLMHRVELEDIPLWISITSYHVPIVPNAPCGVGRCGALHTPCTVWRERRLIKRFNLVPNAPCGVGSIASWVGYGFPFLFLMHRVELEGLENFWLTPYGLVPNAPCGVGSRISSRLCGSIEVNEFLMHRVELEVDLIV